MGLDANAYQVVQAEVFQNRWHPPTDVAIPLFIGGVTGVHVPRIASCLAQAYPPRHEVHWIQAGAAHPSPSLELKALAFCSMPDRCETLLIPPLAEEASIHSLANVLARLRAPGGCPWDHEQTLDSMRIQILSEVHEVIEAIDLQDDENLQEEIGDLIMDTLFLVHIAQTDGKFQLADVVTGICQKMIRRHPHVYGEVSLPDSDTVLSQWDEIKKAEKAARSSLNSQPFDNIPDGLPALEAAREIQSKAQKLDIALPDWGDHAHLSTGPWTEERLGQTLWHLVQSAADDGVVAETALRKWNTLVRKNPSFPPDPP